MKLLDILRRVHRAIHAYILKKFRTREVLRVVRSTHSQELSTTPITSWPLVKARHDQEIQAIKAGKLDIVDRKSWAWPYLPASVQRLSIPISKATPYNIRRMSRTPVPRRAYNLIKGAVISQPWDVRPLADVEPIDGEDEQNERIKIAKAIFKHPNNQDSFQSFVEMGLEDMLTFGAMATEIGYTPDVKRPIKMWQVNVESIRLFASWTEGTPDMPHYAQMTGLKGERGAILFYDDELLYLKDNPSTDNPFGLGKMEVAFQSINHFLGVQDMSGKAGADQIHKSWLWWEQPQTDAAYQVVRRHIQNELEGQAKVSIIGGMKKPEIIEIVPVTEADLLLGWQELLIRMIANAFDMSAMALGIEHDVNRAVGQVLDDKDFRSAVVPIAKRVQEAFTRKILHQKLQWFDLEFAFTRLEDPDIETLMTMFSKLYSMNATTPNRTLKALGMEKLDNPFADLTQFECMMINMEAMQKVSEETQTRMMQRSATMQDQQQDKQMQRQKEMMQQQPDDQSQGPQQQGPQQQGQPGQGGAGGQGPGGPATSLKLTPGNVAKGGQPPSPKPLSLPKFPIAGSRYNAKQIAMMPVNQVQDAFMTGALSSPTDVLNDMVNQEPGILDEMSDEVKEFFDKLLKEEKKPKKKLNPSVLKEWQKDQAARFKKNAGRERDLTQFLVKKGQGAGRPGSGGVAPFAKPGTPGYINPTKKF